MLAAIDAYFSASDGTEAEVAENLLLDVRDEINKQKYVPETNFGNMAEPKIGCVNHDCDKCKAVQEPVAEQTPSVAEKIKARADGTIRLLEASGLPQYQIDRISGKVNGLVEAYEIAKLYTAPPAAQKPWVGLTDEEANKIYTDTSTFGEMLRAVEVKLKEKNT
jgi:hypothetical protein